KKEHISPPTWQVSSRFTPFRFALWQRPTTRRRRLPRGHQFRPTPHAGRSAFLIFTPSSPSLTGFLPALLPIHTTATSTFFLLIPLSPVAALPPSSTSTSSRHCARSAPQELPPMPVLSPGHFSTAMASNSTQRSASSAEALISAGLPCTNNSAVNETPN